MKKGEVKLPLDLLDPRVISEGAKRDWLSVNPGTKPNSFSGKERGQESS